MVIHFIMLYQLQGLSSFKWDACGKFVKLGGSGNSVF